MTKFPDEIINDHVFEVGMDYYDGASTLKCIYCLYEFYYDFNTVHHPLPKCITDEEKLIKSILE